MKVDSKSTQSTPKASVKQSPAKAKRLPKGMTPKELSDLAGTPDDQEYVSVPCLSQPYAKAPPVDPYLKPESITSEEVKYGEVSLPPILTGIQPSSDLSGGAKDYRVKVIWVSRRQIDAAVREVARLHPDTAQIMQIVERWMCNLDTARDEAGIGISFALANLKGEAPSIPHALNSLANSRHHLGRWNDEHRVHLY